MLLLLLRADNTILVVPHSHSPKSKKKKGKREEANAGGYAGYESMTNYEGNNMRRLEHAPVTAAVMVMLGPLSH